MGITMMKTKLTNKWKKISVILGGMCALATLTFNCSPALFESAKGSGSGSTFDTFSAFESTNAPLTLLTAEQTYQSMLNVTGQSDAPVSRTEYMGRFGTFSSTPTLTNLNSPLMLASTSLAGDICNNLIAKESAGGATRRYFAAVNFSAAPDAASYQSAVAAMATSFWGRAISSEESGLLNGFYTDMTSTGTKNAAMTRAVTLGACAAMLSSFDSLVY
jgi:hypothetical protein